LEGISRQRATDQLGPAPLFLGRPVQRHGAVDQARVEVDRELGVCARRSRA
jgi:hypothetical protein